MLLQPRAHGLAKGHGDQGQGDIAYGIGLDEGLAQAPVDLLVVPAHGRSRADDSAHGRAADEVDRRADLAQGANGADMGVGPCAASGQHQPHRAAGQDPGDAVDVGIRPGSHME